MLEGRLRGRHRGSQGEEQEEEEKEEKEEKVLVGVAMSAERTRYRRHRNRGPLFAVAAARRP